MIPADDGRWCYNVKEVAAILGDSEDCVRRLINSGRLKAVRTSPQRLKITKYDLQRFLELPIEPAPEPAVEAERPLRMVH